MLEGGVPFGVSVLVDGDTTEILVVEGGELDVVFAGEVEGGRVDPIEELVEFVFVGEEGCFSIKT